MTTTTSACKHCKSWQPERTAPRMLQLGFASCAHHPLPGRTFSAETNCNRFVALPVDQITSRRAAAVERMKQLKESK